MLYWSRETTNDQIRQYSEGRAIFSKYQIRLWKHLAVIPYKPVNDQDNRVKPVPLSTLRTSAAYQLLQKSPLIIGTHQRQNLERNKTGQMLQ